MPLLLTAALVGAGAVAVNMYLAGRAAKSGYEQTLFGYPVRSIGLLAGLLAPIFIGGPFALAALAFGLGSAWPVITQGSPLQIPGGQQPQFQPPPRY